MTAVPIGTVCPFAGQVTPLKGDLNDVWKQSACAGTGSAPVQTADAPITLIEAQGWMLCDGRWLSRNAYPELYAVLGFLYGRSTNSTGGDTFRLPDYRGLFMRGFDAGAGMDPGADDRLIPAGGTDKGNQVGSRQCDAFQEHSHPYQVTNPSAVSQTGQAAGTSVVEKQTGNPSPTARSTTETRGRNVAVNYIIRYR